MQGKQLYEYAVFRVVPRVEREEFINVGVILFSREAAYIGIKYRIDEAKLRLYASELDLNLLAETLRSFEKIAGGKPEGGEIAALDITERFRWLTAVRSTCLQVSPSHNGFTDHPEKTLRKLFEELVV